MKSPIPIDQHCGFISFLSIAQKLQIDFLPVSWQPALQGIGLGGTAEIRQSLMNLQMTFAFKRARQPSGSGLHETHIFRCLIAEILVLGHPSIYGHPNILRLEGICWDVSPEDEKVLPVLVFEKSQYGDLGWFANSGSGIHMSFEHRLKLCADIVVAVQVMHSNSIIHGDIKPQNVLIFEDGSGGFTAKVIDFGYSTQFAGEETLINMPKSWPWNAPEYHHRGFKPVAAIKMDVFALGLLCFWLLYKDHLAGSVDDLRMERCSTSCHSPCGEHQRYNIAKLKFERKLLVLAGRATMSADVNDERKESLRQFFSSTLTYDTANRNSDLRYLSSLLVADRATSPCEKISCGGRAYELLDNFQVSPIIGQLTQADYRVRRYIVACLQVQTCTLMLDQSHQASLQSIAFQLAVCYHTSFGVRRDVEKSQVLLTQSRRNYRDLHNAVETAQQETEPQKTRHSNFNTNLRQGSIIIYPAQYYSSYQHQKHAEMEYIREIADMASVFGNNQNVVVKLKSALAYIYYGQGSYDKSKELWMQCAESRSITVGQEHPQTLHYRSQLAKTLWKLGQWKEAETQQLQITEMMIDVFGLRHSATLATMNNLAATCQSQGRWEDAEWLQTRVLAITKEIMGQEHPETQSCLHALASNYQDQGRWEDALGFYLSVMETTQRILGQRHQITLTSMADLSVMYSHLGRWKEAVQIGTQVMEARGTLLGWEHSDTLESMICLALSYQNLGQWKDAEHLHLEILKTIKLDPEHPTRLTSMANLAILYRKQGRWKEAEAVGIEVLEQRQRILGQSHPDTLTSMNNLALTYSDQTRWKEAEDLQEKLLKLSQLGQDHPLTLGFMGNIAATYTSQQRWKEAEDIFVKIQEKKRAILGHEHPDTLITMANLAGLHYDQHGREKEAEVLYLQVLEIQTKTLGTEHPDTLTCARNVAESLRKQGRFEEAERIHRQTLSSWENLHGKEHHNTLSSKEILAETLRVQGKYEEAEQLHRQALAMRESVLGEEHPSTLSTMGFLQLVLRQQGKYGESDLIHRQAVERKRASSSWYETTSYPGFRVN